MVKISLPWLEGSVSFEAPEENLIEVLSPNFQEPVADLDKAISDALSSPIGVEPMEKWVKPGNKVLLISDDNTRPTPSDKLIPPLLAKLNAAGVPDGDITVLMALGTHRYMTQAEMEAKTGREVYSRVKVANHLWRDPNELVDLGKTASGIALAANKLLTQSDVIIGIGAIVPHHIPGFSGGSKIIQPGVCGPKTTAETHLLSCEGGGDSYLGQIDNPVRKALDEMAEKVRLSAILNVVLTPSGETAGVFFGHYRAAFLKGVELARTIYGVKYHETPDIVVSNSHPCDLDFWQAHKSQYPAQIMVNPGGVIILATPCPEGISPVHTDLAEFARLGSKEILSGYRQGKLKNGVAVALAMAWAMVREKATVITWSTGLTPQELGALGHIRAESLEWAIAEALRIKGPKARITVLTHAPDMLPIKAA